MLLSIGNVRSTTRLNLSCTGAWAPATAAIPTMPSAKKSKAKFFAFIIAALLFGGLDAISQF